MKIAYRTTHKRLADGRKKVYYYALSNGKRFFETMDYQLTEPFPQPVIDAYKDAIAEPVSGDMERFVRDYLTKSKRFEKLAAATKTSYRMHAKAVTEKFGSAPLAVIEHRKFRGAIIAWHEERAETSPKSADDAIQVLRNVLAYAKSRGLIIVNHAEDIERAYQSKDDKRPFLDDEIELFLKDCPQTIADIFWLASHTGLRRKDLAEITWNEWKGAHIERNTSKSRYKRMAIIPLTDAAQTFLADLKRRQMDSKLGLQRTMIVGAFGGSLTPNTVGGKINSRCKALGIEKTLHNCRNLFATLLVRAGFKETAIADIMGWNVEDVRQLIRIYVRKEEIVASQVARLESARSKT